MTESYSVFNAVRSGDRYCSKHFSNPMSALYLPQWSFGVGMISVLHAQLQEQRPGPRR